VKRAGYTISRRGFLGRGATVAFGAGLALAGGTTVPAGPCTARGTGADPANAGGDSPGIREYRDLGKTGWKVSDIAFGNASLKDPAMLEYAIERGINYVDTARQYYDMEVVIGKIFPEKRSKIFLTTKLLPELVTADVSVQKVLAAIEESLKRLNTDYVDCCLVHSVGDPNQGDPERYKNRNTYEAFHRAKRQGKIRFWGASSHGPKAIEAFNWLLEETDIDLIMPGMNFMTVGLEPVLAKAGAKGVAVVAMKSLSAARKIDYSTFMKRGRTVRQAVLKWMLAQRNISTIAITMSTYEQIDEYVAASGKPRLSPEEKGVLEEYGLLLSRDYCRPGCDKCLDACPEGLPIPDILRYRLYFETYGREKYAMGLYSALPGSKRASGCDSCDGQCDRFCPYQVPIRKKLMEAHHELSA